MPRPPVRITSLEDPRVDVFRDVRDRDLRGHGHLFMAESELVFRRLMRRPECLHSVMVNPRKYAELAESSRDVRRTSLFAQTRSKQLNIWADLQERRAELAELRTRVGLSSTDTDEAVLAIDANSRYIVMGTLSVSCVYNGSKLPKLYRLQEPGTGRTVAYLRPSDEADLIPMLGQLIGIVGEKSYDPGLRLTLVTPRRIDLLAPRK